jgi:hypothetical protein
MRAQHIEALDRFVKANFDGGSPKQDRLLAAKVVWARHRIILAKAGKRLGPRADPRRNRAMHGLASGKKSALTIYHGLSAIRCRRLP